MDSPSQNTNIGNNTGSKQRFTGHSGNTVGIRNISASVDTSMKGSSYNIENRNPNTPRSVLDDVTSYSPFLKIKTGPTTRVRVPNVDNMQALKRRGSGTNAKLTTPFATNGIKYTNVIPLTSSGPNTIVHVPNVDNMQVDCRTPCSRLDSNTIQGSSSVTQLHFTPTMGTDGSTQNSGSIGSSSVDEMYLASLINKGWEVYSKGTTDPTALPAEIVLQMATINGAKSVLWDSEIRSLEVGKKADIIVVNPFSWTMVPFHDCISSLVYSMRSENVISVMCNGRWIMKVQKILNVDEKGIISIARSASTELLKRAGIHITSRMNFV